MQSFVVVLAFEEAGIVDLDAGAIIEDEEIGLGAVSGVVLDCCCGLGKQVNC